MMLILALTLYTSPPGPSLPAPVPFLLLRHRAAAPAPQKGAAAVAVDEDQLHLHPGLPGGAYRDVGADDRLVEVAVYRAAPLLGFRSKRWGKGFKASRIFTIIVIPGLSHCLKEQLDCCPTLPLSVRVKTAATAAATRGCRRRRNISRYFANVSPALLGEESTSSVVC